MNKLTFCLILLSLSFILACSDHGDFVHRLHVADTLMHRDADSAFRMLSAMNNEAEQMPEKLRMQHLLLRCNAQNKVDSLFHDDSLGCLLTQYFDRKGTPNQRMLAYYILGCAYRDMGDMPSALLALNKATISVDTLIPDCNYYQLSVIHEKRAFLYANLGMADDALKAYNMAVHLANILQDSLRMANIIENMADAWVEKGRVDSMLYLKEKATAIYKKFGTKQMAARSGVLSIKWYAQQGDFAKAKAALDAYEAHSGYFLENGEVEPGHEDYYDIKGHYFLNKGHIDSAGFYFQKLEDKGTSLKSKYLASIGLHLYHKAKERTDSALVYLIRGMELYDSIHNLEVVERTALAQANFDYTHYRKKMLQLKRETKSKANKWIFFSCGTCIVLIILLLITNHYRLQSHLRGIKLKISQGANFSLKSQMEEYKHLTEKLHQNTNHQNVTEYLTEDIHRFMTFFEQRMDAYQKQIKDRKESTTPKSLQKLSIVQHMFTLAKHRKQCPTEEDWKAVYMVMENKYTHFAEIQQMKNISDQEYKICILAHIGFRPSDIAFLIGTTTNHLAVIRPRLLKKIFNIEGGAPIFDEYIRKIT